MCWVAISSILSQTQTWVSPLTSDARWPCPGPQGLSNVTPCHQLSANHSLDQMELTNQRLIRQGARDQCNDHVILSEAILSSVPQCCHCLLNPARAKPSWTRLMCPSVHWLHSHVPHSSIWILCLVTKWKVRHSLTGWETSSPPQDFYQNKHKVK